jgi:hypothetical protein
VSEWNADMSAAPHDGSQFLAALSNGWVVIISEVPNWHRYAWYRVSGNLSVPVAETHSKDSLKDSILATHWQPLPKHPGENP